MSADEDDIIGPSLDLFKAEGERNTCDSESSKAEYLNVSYEKVEEAQLSDNETTSETEDVFVGPSLNFLKRKYSEKTENLESRMEKIETAAVCLEDIPKSQDDVVGPSLDLFNSTNTFATSDNASEIVQTLENDNNDNEPPIKRKRVKDCELFDVFLKYLPQAKYYQISYMHRSPLTNVQFSKSGFLITASVDGHVKFWKKAKIPGLDFVKEFRAHLGTIVDVKISPNGDYLATIGVDKTVKVFDILNCDMINMIKLNFIPYCCCWIYSESDAFRFLAVSEADSKNIYIINVFDKYGVVKKIDDLHEKAVNIIIFNPVYEAIVSFDTDGMIEYWSGVKNNYELPNGILWQYKTDTDLYKLFIDGVTPITASFSPDGELFAVYSSDRKIRIFNFRTACLINEIDESIQMYTESDLTKEIASMEFGRRLAVEKELERNEFKFNLNIEFDSTSSFIVYTTLMGVKIVDVKSSRVYRLLGCQENVRFLNVAVSFISATSSVDPDLLMVSIHDNETVEEKEMKMPLIVCTGFKRNRFYLFTNDEPIQTTDADGNVEIERDVMNEKPTKEEILAASDSRIIAKKSASKVLENFAILHTSMGDIHLQLFPNLTPKTVENFISLSKSGYYNGRIFHRVVKNFMIQSGCPFGNGSGGTSIWGDDFEDEFHPSLGQDKPYLLCMANTGAKNTNGSQFFITLKPCPWLENKHTIFGKATKGMEIIQKINSVVTDKNDKPLDDVTITSVTVKHVSQ